MTGSIDSSLVELIVMNYSGDMDDISEATGLSPTFVTKNEEKAHARFLKDKIWRYKIVGERNEEVEDLLDKLLSMVHKNINKIFNISKNADIKIAISTSTENYNSEFFVTNKQLDLINALGASLWIDLYTYPRTYLQTFSQKQKLIRQLVSSHSQENSAQKLVELLSLIEKFKIDVFPDLFIEYADGSSMSEEDISYALKKSQSYIDDIIRTSGDLS